MGDWKARGNREDHEVGGQPEEGASKGKDLGDELGSSRIP